MNTLLEVINTAEEELWGVQEALMKAIPSTEEYILDINLSDVKVLDEYLWYATESSIVLISSGGWTTVHKTLFVHETESATYVMLKQATKDYPQRFLILDQGSCQELVCP